MMEHLLMIQVPDVTSLMVAGNSNSSGLQTETFIFGGILGLDLVQNNMMLVGNKCSMDATLK